MPYDCPSLALEEHSQVAVQRENYQAEPDHFSDLRKQNWGLEKTKHQECACVGRALDRRDLGIGGEEREK